VGIDLPIVAAAATAPVVLHHGITYTNRLLAGGSQDIIVPVPAWAEWATNVLLFAANNGTGNPANIGVWFNHTNRPTNPVDAMFWPPVVERHEDALGEQRRAAGAAAGTELLPHRDEPEPVWDHLFLRRVVRHVHADELPAGDECCRAGGVPRYFQFDVPDETVLPGEPRNVSVWLSGVQSNVTVVMSQSLPLPDLAHYDYISKWPATNGEVLMLVTNSTPWPIQTNRWYIGVFNQADTNVAFTIEACYATNYPTIIDLTNAVAFTVSETTNVFAAPPGPPRQFFFRFEITNFVESILFELLGCRAARTWCCSGICAHPGAIPARQLPRGPDAEQIVVRPDIENRDLRGLWYLGIYSRELTNLTYSIRAAVTDTNGMLISAQPVADLVARMLPPGGCACAGTPSRARRMSSSSRRALSTRSGRRSARRSLPRHRSRRLRCRCRPPAWASTG